MNSLDGLLPSPGASVVVSYEVVQVKQNFVNTSCCPSLSERCMGDCK